MKTIIEVPMSEISTASETGETIAPEKGDQVTVTTQGRFVEALGDRGRVEIGADDSENGEPDDATMERELSAMHEQSQRGGMME